MSTPHPDNPASGAATLAASRPGRRLFVNSLSSYARLGATFVIGLILVRYLLGPSRLGAEGVGLYLLMTSSVGIAGMLQVIVRSSLLRELSVAHDSGDARLMTAIFTASVVATWLMAIVLAAVMLGLTPVALWAFKFPPAMAFDMKWSWMVISLFTAGSVLAVPFVTLFNVLHRVPVDNLITAAQRAASLFAAVLVFDLTSLHVDHPLLAFIAADSVCVMAAMVMGGLAGFLACPAARVRLRLLDRSQLTRMLFTGRYVAMLEIATNLFVRTNQLLLNVFLGPVVNAIFGAVALLVGYIRQIATGLVYGIEPMAARFSAGAVRDDARSSVAALMLTVTRIQSGVVMPVIAVLAVFAPVFVDFWLGDTLESRRFAANRDVANLLLILLVGSPFFVIMQGTLRVMLGAGDVKWYAPKLVYAGVVQAVIALSTLLLSPWAARLLAPHFSLSAAEAAIFPQNVALYGVAAGMSLDMLVTYGWYIPSRACSLYQIRPVEMYRGAIAPGFVVGAIAGGVAIAFRIWTPPNGWTVTRLILGIAVAALAAAIAAWIVILKRNERARLLPALLFKHQSRL